MYVDPPPFRMTDSTEIPLRLGRLEAWVIRHAEWVRQAASTTEVTMAEVLADLDELRSWMGKMKAEARADKRTAARLIALWAAVGTFVMAALTRLLGL